MRGKRFGWRPVACQQYAVHCDGHSRCSRNHLPCITFAGTVNIHQEHPRISLLIGWVLCLHLTAMHRLHSTVQALCLLGMGAVGGASESPKMQIRGVMWCLAHLLKSHPNSGFEIKRGLVRGDHFYFFISRMPSLVCACILVHTVFQMLGP